MICHLYKYSTYFCNLNNNFKKRIYIMAEKTIFILDEPYFVLVILLEKKKCNICCDIIKQSQSLSDKTQHNFLIHFLFHLREC